MRGRVGATLLVLALLLILGYLLFNDEPFSAAPSGSRLGWTHYEAEGPESAPAVVLIHGVSGPMKVWDKTFPALVASGRRVVRYDLLGRGLSERVKAEYNEALYDKQLRELIEGLNLKPPLTLVGSSMGAIIAAGFRNRHPELVHSLVLIGPAGFPIEASPLAKLLDVPLIGDYLMAVAGPKVLRAHHRKYFVRPDDFTELDAAFAQQLKVKGTKRAILSTMRHMPVQDFQAGYSSVGMSNVPVLLLWGTADQTFPFSNNARARAYIPRARFVPIPTAAHLPQYEAPELTNREILKFLK